MYILTMVGVYIGCFFFIFNNIASAMGSVSSSSSLVKMVSDQLLRSTRMLSAYTCRPGQSLHVHDPSLTILGLLIHQQERRHCHLPHCMLGVPTRYSTRASTTYAKASSRLSSKHWRSIEPSRLWRPWKIWIGRNELHSLVS